MENKKEYHRLYMQRWRQTHNTKNPERDKVWRDRNKDRLKKYRETAKLKDLAKYLEYHKNYQKKWFKDKKSRPEEIQKRAELLRARAEIKSRNRENLKLSRLLRSRLITALKLNLKSGTALSLLGCSIEEFRTHLENKFTEGMSWENRGYRGWHIDHIKPCALFDLSDPLQQKECFHYTNTQPMWGTENMKKNSKFIES